MYNWLVVCRVVCVNRLHGYKLYWIDIKPEIPTFFFYIYFNDPLFIAAGFRVIKEEPFAYFSWAGKADIREMIGIGVNMTGTVCPLESYMLTEIPKEIVNWDGVVFSLLVLLHISWNSLNNFNISTARFISIWS